MAGPIPVGKNMPNAATRTSVPGNGSANLAKLRLQQRPQYPGPHLPLDRRNIRVLHLDMGPLNNIEAYAARNLAGVLRVFDVDDKLSFVALSYVWGKNNSVNPRRIYIRQQDLPDTPMTITENCFQALTHLRALGVQAIWVDAICINQTDDMEKGHQVRFMGDIYSSATKTYVWLGPGTSGSWKAMSYLRALGTASERIKLGMAFARSEKARTVAAQSYGRLFWQDIKGTLAQRFAVRRC